MVLPRWLFVSIPMLAVLSQVVADLQKYGCYYGGIDRQP